MASINSAFRGLRPSSLVRFVFPLLLMRVGVLVDQSRKIFSLAIPFKALRVSTMSGNCVAIAA